jgi:hypothetical protein
MFGLQPDEVEHLSPKLKEALSFHYASQGEVNRHRIATAIQRWRRTEYDIGSPEVQGMQKRHRDNMICVVR